MMLSRASGFLGMEVAEEKISSEIERYLFRKVSTCLADQGCFATVVNGLPLLSMMCHV